MPPYQVVYNKMKKLKVMLADPLLAAHIPETVYFSLPNLKEMLSKYYLVYVKPNRGSGGERVMAISMNKSGACRIHYKTRIVRNQTVEEAAAFAAEIAGGDRFMIQQGIRLMTIDDKPFDLRIHLQKPFDKWEATGFLAKIAPPDKVITNRRRGGTLLDLSTALQKAGLPAGKIKELLRLMISLCKKAAAILNSKYPGLRELGVDIGLDGNSKPWIFEVNTKPQYPPGNEKVDRYRKIIRKR